MSGFSGTLRLRQRTTAILGVLALGLVVLSACTPPGQTVEVRQEDCNLAYNGWASYPTQPTVWEHAPWGSIYDCQSTNILCNKANFSGTGRIPGGTSTESAPVPVRVKNESHVYPVDGWDEAGGVISVIGSMTYDEWTVVAASQGQVWNTCGPDSWMPGGPFTHQYTTPTAYKCKTYHVASLLGIPWMWDSGWKACNG